MKLGKRFGLTVIGLAAAAAVMTGCTETNAAKPAAGEPDAVKTAVTEESLGLRKTTLYSEQGVAPEKTEYINTPAGSGQTFNRAFQDAPPMIPHGVEGMLPVTKANNACKGCHMPNIAPAVQATAIPSSHFLDMRPKHKFDGKEFKKSIDNMKNETSVKKINKLAGARFNCTQCHAPQSQTDLAVDNTFRPEYTDPEGKHKSTWEGTKLYEGLDTVQE